MLKNKQKNIKGRLILFFSLICCIPIVFIAITKYEGTKPEFRISKIPRSIGTSFKIDGQLIDKGCGLRKVWIAIFKDGKETVLFEKDYENVPPFSIGKVHEQGFSLEFKPKDHNILDGKAMLRMVLTDQSFRNWFKGNKTYIEKEIEIDTKPPEIEVLTSAHNINQGGSALIIYQVNEKNVETGVQVGDNFFYGYGGYFKNPNLYLAFFALRHDQNRKTEMYVSAVDAASNRSQTGFYYHIRSKNFKKDVISVSDRFINRKIPEFFQGDSSHIKEPLVEKFLKINNRMRKDNFKKIVSVCQKTEQKLYWQGAFTRLPKSATRSGFADFRSYKYKNQVIDHQYHLGIDLASLKHSSVPAGNNGKIVFAGNLGIYGKTVIIDHGFSLFSLYAHLSKINVQAGDRVEKDELIGQTGSTGLAGGDHLHFSVIIQNVFVNPLEWWDPHWINNNITSKIDALNQNKL